MGRLTTHILNTADGCPASGVSIKAYSNADGERKMVAHGITNQDGRLAQPLLADENFTTGIYELDFYIGDYFTARQNFNASPPFLDVVTVRFGVNADAHYHVPLLVSPYGYTTYRGS